MIRNILFILFLAVFSLSAQTKILLDPGHDYITTGKTGPVFKDASGKNKYAMVASNKQSYILDYITENKLEDQWKDGYRFNNARLIDPKSYLKNTDLKLIPSSRFKEVDDIKTTSVYDEAYSKLEEKSPGVKSLGRIYFDYAKSKLSCGLVEADINFKIA